MSYLEQLISELCPDGVEYRQLWEVTTWDKRFNAVENNKQPKIITYPYLLASDLFSLRLEQGDVFLLSTGEQTGWTTQKHAGSYLCEGEVVTIPWGKSRPVKDVMKYYKGKFVTADNRIATSSDTRVLNNKFLFYWMQTQGEVIDTYYRGSGIKHPSMADVLDMSIPLPPLPVQEEIVRILDKFTALEAELEAELEARTKQYKLYRLLLLPKSTESLEGIKWFHLADVFDVKNGYTPSKANSQYWQDGTIPWFRMEDIRRNGRILSDAIQHVSKNAIKGSLFDSNSIIISTTATIGEHALITVDFLANQQLTCLTIKDDFKPILNIKFAFFYCFILGEFCKSIVNRGGGLPIIDMDKLKRLRFPIPNRESQLRIVSILDRFDALVNDITQGLPAELAARRRQYEYYRDKLLTFKEKVS